MILVTANQANRPIEYQKQPRNLYEKVNILSIPMGLYGNKIKPGSFYLSASKSQIIDDKYGNLIIIIHIQLTVKIRKKK